MKKRKLRIIAAILAVMMVGTLTLTACNSNGGSSPDGKAENAQSEEGQAPDSNNADDDSKEYDIANKSDHTVDIGTPSQKVNADDVYSKMTYTPEMFCNTYTLLGGDDTVKEKITETGFYKYNEKAASGGGVERQITNLPYYIDAEKCNYKDPKTGANILYVMSARFYNEKGDTEYKNFKYTIEGRKIKLKEIKNIKRDKDNYKTITSFEEAQLELAYSFAFKGTRLTLDDGSKQIKLYSCYLDPKKDTTPRFNCNGFLAKGSPMIDHIAGFGMHYSEKSTSIYITFINDKNEDETSNYCHGVFKEDGTFTFSIPYATETKTYQYVYILLDHGFILTDGTTNYKYTEKEEEFKKYKLSAILGEGANADEISAEKQKELTIAQNAILTDLEKAFEKKNMKVNIDKATGRVSLDSNILFAKDSSDLSDDGKKTLDDFLDVYTSVLLNDKNKNLVANIIVEGHTDTDGDHDYNQKLSEKRAETVAKYCTDKVPSLKNIIKSKGYSYDQPVLKDDGTIDMDASRRVVFKFTLDKK